MELRSRTNANLSGRNSIGDIALSERDASRVPSEGFSGVGHGFVPQGMGRLDGT